MRRTCESLTIANVCSAFQGSRSIGALSRTASTWFQGQRCACRKELDKLLPEEFRRFDVADKSYVKSQAGSYRAQAAAEPPPRRITVMEPPVDHRADPVTGYAKLGYAGQVCLLLNHFHRRMKEGA